MQEIHGFNWLNGFVIASKVQSNINIGPLKVEDSMYNYLMK